MRCWTQHLVVEVLARFVELPVPQLGAVLGAHVLADETLVLVLELGLAIT